jgi:hypothetical protein
MYLLKYSSLLYRVGFRSERDWTVEMYRVAQLIPSFV